MLGILLGLILFTINPIEQLAKAKDTQRQSDIKQLQTALDTFYNDTNCYPLASGEFLTIDDLNSNYIKDIPVDPDGRGYAYLEGATSCPQWNALFTRLDSLPEDETSCPLLQIEEDIGSSCTPTNYETGYNFCAISGEINCSEISSASVPDLGIPVSPPSGGGTSTNTPTPSGGVTNTNTPTPPTGGTATNTPTPTLSPTPSPTPPAFACTGTVYAYPSGSQNCNAIFPVTQCTFAGGNLVCYQNRTGTTCVNPICTDYQ
jgi:type II secretory pathway pseudopilin PulG